MSEVYSLFCTRGLCRVVRLVFSYLSCIPVAIMLQHLHENILQFFSNRQRLPVYIFRRNNNDTGITLVSRAQVVIRFHSLKADENMLRAQAKEDLA